MKIKQLSKSKTVDFNVLAGAGISVASAFGVDIPVEAATGIMALINIALRMFTNKSISEK